MITSEKYEIVIQEHYNFEVGFIFKYKLIVDETILFQICVQHSN